MGTPPVTVKAKVLLVDDEENILRSLRRLLADEEYEVVTATGGEEGLRILTKRARCRSHPIRPEDAGHVRS